MKLTAMRGATRPCHELGIGVRVPDRADDDPGRPGWLLRGVAPDRSIVGDDDHRNVAEVEHRPMLATQPAHASGAVVEAVGTGMLARVEVWLRPVARRATLGVMTTTISQREFRNESGDIMRRLDQGETFIVTRNGMPVGELSPLRRLRFVTAETVTALFHHAPPIDAAAFRADLDAAAGQDIEPRG